MIYDQPEIIHIKEQLNKTKAVLQRVKENKNILDPMLYKNQLKVLEKRIEDYESRLKLSSYNRNPNLTQTNS